MTLDQQDTWLDRHDPLNYPPGLGPLSIPQWNREKNRVRRARQQTSIEVHALLKPCRCKNCRRNRRPPFPRYYIANSISFECWLEQQTVDPELREILQKIRNDRPRIGSAFLGRKPQSNSRPRNREK